jgi:hypothetical protein
MVRVGGKHTCCIICAASPAALVEALLWGKLQLAGCSSRDGRRKGRETTRVQSHAACVALVGAVKAAVCCENGDIVSMRADLHTPPMMRSLLPLRSVLVRVVGLCCLKSLLPALNSAWRNWGLEQRRAARGHHGNKTAAMNLTSKG